MPILELPSLHQSGAAQSGRVIGDSKKNTIAKRLKDIGRDRRKAGMNVRC
jgi:hypothetical protein